MSWAAVHMAPLGFANGLGIPWVRSSLVCEVGGFSGSYDDQAGVAAIASRDGEGPHKQLWEDAVLLVRRTFYLRAIASAGEPSAK
jgi:hypothetical protein